MKYIKTFENQNNKPKVGDYVILYDDTYIYADYVNYSDFINNNVGRIININIKDYGNAVDVSYDVEYKNIPDDIKKYFDKHVYGNRTRYYDTSRAESDIISIFKNEEDAELYIQSKKYNL